MDGTPFVALPAKLHMQIRELDHDLKRARESLAAGKLQPEQYTKLAGILDARIEALEAEVSARMLLDVQAPKRRVIGAN